MVVASGLEGVVDAGSVRRVTRYNMGGVPSVGHCTALPAVMVASLWCLPPVHAAARHSHGVFSQMPSGLSGMQRAVVAARIAA